MGFVKQKQMASTLLSVHRFLPSQSRLIYMFCANLSQNFIPPFSKKVWIFSFPHLSQFSCLLGFTVMCVCFREGKDWILECFQDFILWTTCVQPKFLWETSGWMPWKPFCCQLTGYYSNLMWLYDYAISFIDASCLQLCLACIGESLSYSYCEF